MRVRSLGFAPTTGGGHAAQTHPSNLIRVMPAKGVAR